MPDGVNISVGRRDVFAVELTFEADPDYGRTATAEESASWGSMEVWVKGKSLCSHVEEGELSPSVHWYLLPVLEWLTHNWDPLLHEERLPNRNAGDDAWKSLSETRFPPQIYDRDAEDEWRRQWQQWWYRHCIQSCRCGGLLPDIVMRRWQDLVEVSWGSGSFVGVPEDVVFIYPQGIERLDPVAVAQPLYELLQAAIGYLIDRLPSSTRLRDLAQRVNVIRKSPRENRLAWLAGLGSSLELISENWHRVTRTVSEKAAKEVADYLLGVEDDGLVLKGSCHAALMFGSAAPSLNENDLNVLAGKLIELYALDAETSELRTLVAREAVSFYVPAWEIGYHLAEIVIEHLSLADQSSDSVDVSAILGRLGIRQEEIELSDDSVRGVSVAGPHHQPTILLNVSDRHNDTRAGKRFTLAHELCHILFDRTYGQKLAMVSGPWAPLQIEKRANAFAAMLLMPLELVRRVVRSMSCPLASEQGVHEVRTRLETGFVATLEHLKNLGWLDPATAEKIATERDERLARQECA